MVADSLASPGLGTVARPLRILMIAPTSFFADYGCHVRILEEARYLGAQGHHVTICTYHNGRDMDNLEIHRARGVPWRSSYEVGSSRHKIAMDLLLFFRALRSMSQVRPDVIHGHIHEGALIGLVLARLWRCPLVCDLQGSLSAEMADHHFVRKGSLAHRAFRWLEGFVDRRARRILASTRLYAGKLIQDFGCRQDRVTYVPDCVNTQVFAPKPRDRRWEAYRQALGIPGDRRVVVYLGLLAEYQGTGLLLQSAAELCHRRDDLHFLVAGFPNVDTYRELAEQLGIGDRCTFTGKVPYEQAPELLAQGEVAVSPKLSATEGAGKLLNYMAMGLPVVTFDTPVSREYLGDLGIWATPGDAAALALGIEAALDDPALAGLGVRLRQRARDCFDWSRSGTLICQAYSEQIGCHLESN